MCDTLVALASTTAAGATLFAKNSDRERNEAQGLEVHPGARPRRGFGRSLELYRHPAGRQNPRLPWFAKS